MEGGDELNKKYLKKLKKSKMKMSNIMKFGSLVSCSSLRYKSHKYIIASNVQTF